MIIDLLSVGLTLIGLYWIMNWSIHRKSYRKFIGNSEEEMDWILNGEDER